MTVSKQGYVTVTLAYAERGERQAPAVEDQPLSIILNLEHCYDLSPTDSQQLSIIRPPERQVKQVVFFFLEINWLEANK